MLVQQNEEFMKRRFTSAVRFATLFILVALGGIGGPGIIAAKAAPDLTDLTIVFTDAVDGLPLDPADTSSPRATLLSFLEGMERSYQLTRSITRRYEMHPDSGEIESLNATIEEAEKAFLSALKCLDLTEVLPAYKTVGSHEAALYLKEILDRIDLPSYFSVPDTPEDGSAIKKWRIPNTEIDIVLIEEGPREGEYLFSAETVSRIIEFYELVKKKPYKSYAPVSPGFLEFYSRTPGQLIPPRWSLSLPHWTAVRFLDHTVLQWGLLVIPIAAVLVILLFIYRRLHEFSKKLSSPNHLWVLTFFVALVLGAIVFLSYVGYAINIYGRLYVVMSKIITLFGFTLAGIGVFMAFRAIAETIIASPKVDPAGLQASYLRALFNVLGFIAAVVIIVNGLTRIGATLIHVLAGLGIGGLAVALAARPMLEGVIGSFLIFWDSPFQLGQRIKVMGHDGVVESIGLRSTSLVLTNGHKVSIPNSKMVILDIENIDRRPFIEREFTISLKAETPPEKMSQALEIIKEILAVPENTDLTLLEGESNPVKGQIEEAPRSLSHPNVAINQPKFPPRVYFYEITPNTQDIQVFYCYFPPRQWDYLAHADGINLMIKQRFAAEGID